MSSTNTAGQLVKKSSWSATGQRSANPTIGIGETPPILQDFPPYETQETPGQTPPIVQTIENKYNQFKAYQYHQLIIGILIGAAAVLIVKD